MLAWTWSQATSASSSSAAWNAGRYERFDADDKGIYRGEGHSIAWFTDPAANVLSVIQEG